jgi:hypothetical protein
MNLVLALSSYSRPSNNHKRRVLEKARIQKLKNWHENVKTIARSEVDFIKSIFRDEDIEDRDWIRDDETTHDEQQKNSRDLVKEDP